MAVASSEGRQAGPGKGRAGPRLLAAKPRPGWEQAPRGRGGAAGGSSWNWRAELLPARLVVAGRDASSTHRAGQSLLTAGSRGKAPGVAVRLACLSGVCMEPGLGLSPGVAVRPGSSPSLSRSHTICMSAVTRLPGACTPHRASACVLRCPRASHGAWLLSSLGLGDTESNG